MDPVLVAAFKACRHPTRLVRESERGDFRYVGSFPVQSSPVHIQVPVEGEAIPYIHLGQRESVRYKIHLAPALNELAESIPILSVALREENIGHKVAQHEGCLTPSNPGFGKIITIYPAGYPEKESYKRALYVIRRLAQTGIKGINPQQYAPPNQINRGFLLPETNNLAWYTVDNVYSCTFEQTIQIRYEDRRRALKLFAGQGPLDSYIPELIQASQK